MIKLDKPKLVELSQAQKDSHSIENQRLEKILNRIFVVFSSTYSNLWKTKDLKAEGEKAKVWLRSLAQLTEEEIKDGLKNLGKHEKFADYPPNPIQFYQVCKGNYGKKTKTQADKMQDAFMGQINRNTHEHQQNRLRIEKNAGGRQRAIDARNKAMKLIGMLNL